MEKLKIETNAYNERRYGKPWIAKTTFDESGKSSFDFGRWVGEAGEVGTLVINCEIGDIIARGQKDHRNAKNNVTKYYILGIDGELSDELSRAQAYEYWEDKVDDKVNNDIDALNKRYAELSRELAEVGDKIRQLKCKEE